MNFAKRLLMVFGAVALAAIIGVMLTPKALHAVATAVQVVNTSAQPVLTVATDALSSFGVESNCSFSSQQTCDIFPMYTVPAGKIAVIESTSGECFPNAGNLTSAILQFRNSTAEGSNTIDIFLERTHGNSATGAVETWTHSVKAYAYGGGSGAPISARVMSDGAQAGNCYITITGHLLSQ
jgi:hypothetical protein